MNLALVGIALAVAGGCGGKKKVSRHSDEGVRDHFGDFADRACVCKDRACTQRVSAELKTFGEQLAKDGFEPSEPSMRRTYDEHLARAAKCIAQVETAVATAPAKPVEPPKLALDPSTLGASATRDVAEMTRIVRAAIATIAPDIALSQLTASYVRKDGTLDPKYGELELRFTLPDVPHGVVDDPDRPTGAPIPTPPKPVERATENCPTVTFAGGFWKSRVVACQKEKWIDLRCSVTAIWERAIKQGAPGDAVAVIQVHYLTGIGRPVWFFTIKDDVRGVHLRPNWRDDCEVAAPDQPPIKLPKRNPYATP